MNMDELDIEPLPRTWFNEEEKVEGEDPCSDSSHGDSLNMSTFGAEKSSDEETGTSVWSKNNDEVLLSDDEASDEETSYDDDGQPEQRQQQEQQHQNSDPLWKLQENRSNMTIFHFLITVPRWSLSLFLWIASLAIPLKTPQQGLHYPLYRLYKVVDLESASYAGCVKQAYDRLEDHLDEVVVEEMDRIQVIEESNAVVVKQAQEVSNACFGTITKAKESLKMWREAGMDIPFTQDSLQCSENDLHDVMALLGEDYRTAENEITSIFADYVTSAEQSLKLLGEYTQDRLVYDLSYFVTERISPVIGLLENATYNYMSPFQSTIPQSDILVDVDGIFGDIEQALNESLNEIGLLTQTSEEFLRSIQLFQVEYIELNDRLEKANLFVSDLLPPGISKPEYFDLATVSSASELLPSVLRVPKSTTTLASPQQLLQNATSKTFDLLNSTVQSIEEQASKHAEHTVKDLSQNVLGALSFESYDPPRFIGSDPNINSTLDEIDAHDTLASNTKLRIEQSLKEIQNLLAPTNITLPPIASFAPDPVSDDTNNTAFAYLRTNFPSITLPAFFGSIFDWMTTKSWLVEVFFQSFRLWRLERIYSSGAIPDLPEIDFGIHDQIKDQSLVIGLIGKALVRTIITPWTVLLLMAFPICMGVLLFWYPYVSTSCKASDSGTFVATDFFTPILINQANLQGNTRHSVREFECIETHRRMCGDLSSNTVATFQNHEAAMISSFASHSQSRNESILLESCIDPTFSNLFEDTCCGLRGYPDAIDCFAVDNEETATCPIDATAYPPNTFRPLAEYLSLPACQISLFDQGLTDPRLDCTDYLSSCQQIPCAGVNEELVRQETIKTDCEIELYLIRWCQFLLLVLSNAFFINIICILVFRGVRQLFWRSLCPARLIFRTQITEDGEILKGDAQHSRLQRVGVAVERFEKAGRIQLVVACVATIVWCMILVSSSSS